MAGGTSVGEIYVDLDANIEKFKGSLDTAQGKADKFTSSIGKAFSEQFDKAAKASERFALALTGITVGVVAFGKKALSEFSTAEVAQTKLTKVILNHSGATMANVNALNDQAKALSKVGVVQDDVITAAQAQLATFDFTSDAISKVIPGFLDMAVAEKGVNLTMEDMKDLANGLGKAMQGNTELFTKQGFVITDAQKKMLEHGTEMQRVQTIAEVLGSTYDGVNKAMRETFSGQMIVAKNNLGDFEEAVGGLIQKGIKPLLAKFNEWVEAAGGPEGVMKRIQDVLKSLQDNIPALIGLIIGGLVPAMWKWAAASLGAIAPWVPFLVVGAALGVVINEIVKIFGGWSVVLQNVKDSFSEFWNSGVQDFGGWLERTKESLKKFAGALALFATGDFNGKIAEAMGIQEDDQIVTTILNFRDKVIELYNTIKEFLAPVFAFVAKTVTQYLIPALKELWEKHGNEIIKTLKVVGIVIGGVLLVAFAAIVAAIGVVVLAITAFIKYITFLADQWKTGWEQTKQAFIDFKEALITGAKAVADFFTATWGAIVTFFTETLPNAFNNLIATVTYVFTHIPELIGFATGYMLQLIFDFADQAHTKIANFLTAAWDAFVKFFTELPGKTVEFVKNTIDALQDMDRRARIAFANMMEAGKNAVVNGINAILSFFRNLPGNIANALSNLVSTIADKFNEAKNAGQNAVKTMLDNIVGWITDLPRRVSSAVDSFKSKISEIAKRFSFGFNVGFENRASGGPIEAGKLYRTGENGEEWIVPQTNGFVINNDIVKQLKSGMGGGGSYNISNTFVIDNDSRMNIIAKLLEKKEIEAQFGFAK